MLLRALHLLEKLDDERIVDFLLDRAVAGRYTYSTEDCCHLLVVARTLGPKAQPLTAALTSRLRAAIPLLHPAHIGLLAQTLAVCFLRDVAVFEALSARSLACIDSLSETSVTEILTAFETANLEPALGVATLSALADRFRDGDADIKVELLLWGHLLGVDVRVDLNNDALPSTLKGLIDVLAIAPTESCLDAAISATDEASADEIVAQVRPRKLLAATVSVAASTLPDDKCRRLLHRLSMAVGAAPAEETARLTEPMVASLKHISSRRMVVGSLYRVFGGRISANADRLSPTHVIEVLEAYGALSIRDDSVIRVLMQRLNDSKRIVEKSPTLAGRAASIRKLFGGWMAS